MPLKKKLIPTYMIIIIAVVTPVILSIIAFYIYGVQLGNKEHIYPNISIKGIDVSGFTRDEALQTLGLPEYQERIDNAEVKIIFPDYSELIITGNDVNLQHNARDLVSYAYSEGRGRGVMPDAISYLRRLRAYEIRFDIEFTLDEDILKDLVSAVAEEYNERLDASVPRIYEDHIVFTKGAGHVSADAFELTDLAYVGIFESFNEGNPVEIVYTLPETREFIEDILQVRDYVFVQMVSSEFDRRTNSATSSAIGVHFDPIEAARLVGEAEPGKTVAFDLVYTHPKYSQEELESLLFRDILGRRRTHASGTANRLINIEISSEFINGLVLLPGEEFSFNEVVGPRSTARGFRTAPIIARGEFVPGIGGGICQTSSTLYAAIRPTELLVTERRPHGLPITYLPRGWDATVAWGLIDFRFVNNTNYPIRIEIELEERSLTAMVYGTIIDDFPVEAGWYLEESWYLEEYLNENPDENLETLGT